MLLNIFTEIREFIMELLTKFSWGNVLLVLAGVAVGFVMCSMIYLVIVLTSLKKNEDKVYKERVDIDDEQIKRIIRSSKNQYIEESSNLPTNEKLKSIKDISWNLINDIAKMYYPKSNYPIYELSIDELMQLNHYITNRVNDLFAGRVMRNFKSIKIAQILKIVDLSKKINESKAMKTAKKMKVPTIFKATMSVLNVFNPSYWVKKLMIDTTLQIGTNKIATTIIDIVGEETVKIYSKNVFNVEKKIDSSVDNTILEIEQSLENH